jgi:hypothetical protein
MYLTELHHITNENVFPRLTIDCNRVKTSLDMGIIRWASGIPFAEDDPLIMFARTFDQETGPR